MLFTPKITAILEDANSPFRTTRNTAFLRQISQIGAIIGDGTALGEFVIDRPVSGTRYGGQAVGIKVHEDRYGLARIAVIDASAVADTANAASFVIAGGTPFSTVGLQGEYTWRGLQFVGESNALESVTRNTITLTADFANATKTFTAASESTAAVRLGGSGAVDVVTGRLSGTALTLSAGGASVATTFEGRLVGADAISLTGVFANAAALNSKFYAGAVIATGAPRAAFVVGTQSGLTTDTTAFLRGTFGLAGRRRSRKSFCRRGRHQCRHTGQPRIQDNQGGIPSGKPQSDLWRLLRPGRARHYRQRRRVQCLHKVGQCRRRRQQLQRSRL